MDLKETGLEGMELIHLAQDTDKWLGFCEHGNELPGSTQGGEFLAWVTTCFSRRTLLHGLLVIQSVNHSPPVAQCCWRVTFGLPVMNQSGIAAAQSNCHTASAYLLNFLEVSVNTLQLKDQTTMTQIEECIPLEGTHVFNAFILISVSCWIKIYSCQANQGHEK